MTSTTSDEDPRGMLCAGHDDEQLALLRAMLDTVPDAVIAHDAGGRILCFSRGACDLLERSAQEIAELGPFGWVSPDSMQGAANRLETILHEGTLSFESHVRRPDGTLVPTHVSARRVDTARGPVIVATISDASQRRRAEAELAYLAYHDTLTGLSNRRAFQDRLRLAIADTRRHRDLLGLAYIDLDRFKPVNDRWGHETGDGVLVVVAERLLASVREIDMVARLGGDEFVILLPRLPSADELGPLAERILGSVRQPITSNGIECSIDATIGFALLDLEHDDARAFVTKADAAMYAAKHDPARSWILWHRDLLLRSGEV